VKNIANLNYVNGDRKDTTEFAKLLKYESQKIGIDGIQKRWRVVIDFCSFKPAHIKVQKLF
jgi:hypothetical protein